MRGGYEMSSTCIQGGLPRNLGGYHQPNMIMEPHSPASAWQFHPTIPKQEPMEDSGINSGSDCQSSSPGSESEVYSTTNNNVTPSSNRSYYSTPIMPRNGLPIGFHSNMQNMPLHMMYNHTPLSPLLIEEVSSPRDSTSHIKEIKKEFLNDKEPDSTLTPCKSPTMKTTESDSDDPLRRLQMTLEKNGLAQTPLSPKVSEHSMDDDNKSENDLEEYDEHGLRVPRINSHGKVKTFKCKQCDFVAITKLDFWEHTKSHIKADKLLTCPKCPFVTEYKHHLEYHLRNHVGSKPFKCDKCSYSCVNKSMLNSHLKSHSNVYQYRCSDCSYATKYCHSLKLHLRKYSHKPAMVLNPDGSPNPLPIIDVYGTRRGPKLKQSNEEEMQSQKETPLLPFPLQQLMMNPPPMHLPFAYPWLPGSMIFQNLEKLARGGAPSPETCDLEQRNDQVDTSSEVLDLSKDSGEPSHKNRRKGPAFKLDHLVANTSDEEDDEDMSTTTVFENVEVVQNDDRSSSKEKEEIVNNNNKVDDYSCQYCNIAFGDPVLYTMHMGYHGYKNPFTCNMCGEECKDKISFFLHIARTPHS